MSTATPSAYYQAVCQADDDLKDALTAVQAEQDAGRLGTLAAATERVRVLERHLQRCQRLRREHLGTPAGGTAAAGYSSYGMGGPGGSV
jgi:hypothetical protein